MSPSVLVTIFCVLVLVGCQAKPPSPESKEAAISHEPTHSQGHKTDEPAQREETATKIHNDLVVRLQKGERDITVVVDDIGRYLKEPDAPKRRGPVKFVSRGRLKEVRGQTWVEASYFRTYNDFKLGYVLHARLKAPPGDQKEINVRELDAVNVRYTDDLLEARELNEQAIAQLIERLAKPANKVEWSFSVVPGGEILKFSTPMKQLILLGEKARPLLQQRLGDPQIQNEVALVLGAIGDETTVPALIDVYPTVDVREMMKQGGSTSDPHCLKVVCLTFALTYLTGQPIGRSRWGTDCEPENRKRWQEWWDKAKRTFKVPKEKPNATWVPSYPILSERWAQFVRQEFTQANE
jgi:hypothetical protein